MKIKHNGIWAKPMGFGIKDQSGWKSAQEVHQKNPNGSWHKVLDFSPVYIFQAESGGIAEQNPCIYDGIWEGWYVVQPGDYLEYEMLILSGVISSGIELVFTGHAVAPSTKLAFYSLSMMGQTVPVDQNGLSGVAGAQHNFPANVWLTRKIGLQPIVGTTVEAAMAIFEDNTGGIKTAYYRKVTVRNAAGNKVVDIFTNTLHVPQQRPWYSPGDLRNYTYLNKTVLPSFNP